MLPKLWEGLMCVLRTLAGTYGDTFTAGSTAPTPACALHTLLQCPLRPHPSPKPLPKLKPPPPTASAFQWPNPPSLLSSLPSLATRRRRLSPAPGGSVPRHKSPTPWILSFHQRPLPGHLLDSPENETKRWVWKHLVSVAPPRRSVLWSCRALLAQPFLH